VFEHLLRLRFLFLSLRSWCRLLSEQSLPCLLQSCPLEICSHALRQPITSLLPETRTWRPTQQPEQPNREPSSHCSQQRCK